ncbi:phage tail tube protein [Nocardiopsis alba]|uniref:phage tail tube protein n=1 Tax=Nocardiopsis alba TaxID=53437 RepID=UPI003D70358F
MAGMNAHGTILERGNGDATGETPETFTKIANSTNLSGPALERAEIDVTSHDSEDGWQEFIGGLKNAGEVGVDVNYRPSVHDILAADFEDDEPRNYRIVFPDPDETAWEFRAFLKGFEPSFPHDDKAEASLTFKVTGKPKLSAN